MPTTATTPDMPNPKPAVAAPTPRATIALIYAALAGGAVAVALGVYGRVHTPTGRPIAQFGFPRMIDMKVWFATAAVGLALVQLTSALWMYGRLPIGIRPPRRLGIVHRWTGTAAFVVSLPVAYHCLWAVGFADTGGRAVAHSIVGCAFYGAFATKLLALRIDGLPRFALPALGGLLVTLLFAVWFTSALWFFTHIGFPFAP